MDSRHGQLHPICKYIWPRISATAPCICLILNRMVYEGKDKGAFQDVTNRPLVL